MQKRLVLRYTVLALLFVGITGIAVQAPGWLAQLEAAQFTALTVRGRLQHVEPEQISTLAKPYLQAGFMAIDMDALQQTIEKLPWVARVRLRREWPGHLYITIKEEVPTAIWNHTHLINRYGEVFLHNTQGYEQTVLPELNGPEGSQIILLTAYAQMKKLLDNRNADLQQVSLSNRRAWRLQVGKKTPTKPEENAAEPDDPGKAVQLVEVRLGSELVEQRLARFVRAAWPTLKPHLQQVDYVDMRYTNGFAVGGIKQPAAM